MKVKSNDQKLKEAKSKFDLDQDVALLSNSGSLITLNRTKVANMFGISPKQVKFSDVIKNGEYTIL